MQIVLSFKIMCNQRSHHKDLLQPLSFHQCAQEADRSMPLETNICPTVNTWTSWFLIDLRLRNSAHELHNELPPPSLHLLETAKHKTRPTTKWEAEQMKTSLLPDALQVHMFMTQVQWSMQPMHVTIAVPFILAETPSWPGTLVRTWKSTCPRLSCLLLQSCWHTCHFIQIQHLTHLQKLICLKILHVLKWSQLTTRCYRRLCMANIS